MATLPNLDKGVVKDPTPPATDTVVSPITIPNGTILVTTKTTNETIDNVNQIIDYISGDNSPNFIPKSAIVDGGEVFTWTADHSMGTSKLIAAGDMLFDVPAVGNAYIFSFAGVDAIFLADTRVVFDNPSDFYSLEFGSSERAIFPSTSGFHFKVEGGEVYRFDILTSTEYLFNSTQADFNNNNLINVNIITPTIASFTNATHNHQDAAGGGVLLSTLALSDTPDIAYLNTPNTYIAGNRQNFLGSTTGASGINIGAITGNPLTIIDGDVWLNTTSNILFGRINGVNVDLGTPGEVFTWTGDHSMGTFRLIAAAGNDVILDAPLGQEVALEFDSSRQYSFVVGEADFKNNDLINVNIITPTIASFVNATHNHQDAAGGGVLLSTLALSDTADIAYLNTLNVYVAGNRQDFLGLLAGTAGINVGGIAGDPTTQVDGDVWLNTTSNQLFGRINGVNVDLGAGGGTGLTSINADTTAAQIIAVGAGLDIIDAGNTHTISIDSTVVTLTGSQILTNKTIDGNLNTILNINETQMTVSVGVAGTVLTSNGVGVSPTYQLAGTGDVVGPVSATDEAIARFDTATGKLIQNGVIIIDDVANMQAIRSLQFNTFTSPPIGTTHIALVDSDFHINTTVGNSIQIMVDDVAEFQLDATTLDLMNNNLVMGTASIQLSSIAEPGVSGSDSVGRVFMDIGNDNHLSIRRNGASIDLEGGAAGSDTPWTEPHDFAGFLLTWDVTATNDITTQQVGDVLNILYADDVQFTGVRIGNSDGFVLIENTSAVVGDAQTTLTMDSGGATSIQNKMIFQIPAGEDSGTVPIVTFLMQDDAAGAPTRPLLSIETVSLPFLTINASAQWDFFTGTVLNDLERIEIEGNTATGTPSGFTTRMRFPEASALTWDSAADATPNAIGFSSNDRFQVFINNVIEFQVLDSQVDFAGNPITGASDIKFSASGLNNFTGDAGGLITDIVLGNTFQIDINSSTEYEFDNQFFEMNLNAIKNTVGVFTANNDEMLLFTDIGSAAENFIRITDALTANGPIIAADGSDVDIDLNINTKGTGLINLNANVSVSGDLVIGDRFQGNKGGDVTGASTVTLGDGNYFDITGNTNIDFMTTTGWQSGSIVVLQFDANSGANDNTASPPANTAAFDLAGNFAASAGDTITVIFDGTFWRELSRSVN